MNSPNYPYNLPDDHPDRRHELDYQQAREEDERAYIEGPDANPHVVERINIVKESIEVAQRYMAANQPNERAKKLLQDAYMLVGRARMVVTGTPVFLCDGADIEVNP